MAVLKIDHISILAYNPDDVIKFYVDNLGFSLIIRETVEQMHMEMIKLKKGEDYIEILSPIDHEKKTSEGIKHIALLSDDINGDFDFFKNNNIKLLHSEVQKHSGVEFFFAKSPSGEFVEIIQYR